MEIAQSLVVLLLIGCKLPNSQGCTFDLAKSHCTCLFADLKNLFNILTCMQAFVFEFRDGDFKNPMDINALSLESLVPFLQNPINKIIVGNSVLHENFLLTFLTLTQNVRITELVFEDCIFIGKVSWQFAEEKLPSVFYLQFTNVSSASLSDRGKDVSGISSWLAKMQNIIFTRSQITHIPRTISMHFKDLNVLDLSENLFQDQGMNDSFSEGLFPNLRTLKLRDNKLTSFGMACNALSMLPNLQDLDLSQNNFSEPPSSSCEWPNSLLLLNLSRVGLEHVSVHQLPQTLEILDLSYNRLSNLDASLPYLKELYLTRNRLHSLPSVTNFPVLEVLLLDGNKIPHLSKDQLEAFKYLSIVRADQNPYTCSCPVVNEMKELPKSSFVVQQWPEDYFCDSPPELKGARVNDAQSSVFQCHKLLFISIICVLILLVCIVATVCWVRTCCFTQRTA
ncbi:toll-like receptor 2 isoform X2 [Rhinatrema bivittatum]|nr:toll-like receptor 2 isoform X2 [Rhinatrema bivittatum]XP_029439672.1 toll-like receptor 2 isoform X2 [Rhinatrema bivittatum]